jgi:hypothetical protein
MNGHAPPAPGWWIASDGRWYPPELHPSRLQRGTSPTEPDKGSGHLQGAPANVPDYGSGPLKGAPANVPDYGSGPLKGAPANILNDRSAHLGERQEAARPVDPSHWTALKMLAEDSGLAAAPGSRLGSSATDWAEAAERSARKGIRTEITGATWLAWSLAYLAVSALYLSAVVANHSNMSLMLASPLVLGAVLPVGLYRLSLDRRSMAALGSRLPQHSRSQLRWLSVAVGCSLLATAASLVAFGIFWGFQAAKMLRG